MKWFMQIVIADHFYTKFRFGRAISIFLGIVLSWILWVLVHFPANPNIASPPGLLFAFFWSTIWMLPFFILVEPLLDPTPGINWTIYMLSGAVASHGLYDILAESSSFGWISMAHSTLGLIAGIGAVGIGLTVLAIEYYRRGIPIFGFIKI